MTDTELFVNEIRKCVANRDIIEIIDSLDSAGLEMMVLICKRRMEELDRSESSVQDTQHCPIRAQDGSDD